ncbi:TRAP transporter small permease [Oceanobacillus sojae]|uniref:TRAP transporter small permease n=1 Tax=Oceanobacillus sojae TaxID=582851 RepID=UPI0021A65C06|nr:TRAP transporter small permease [Oceanobacillus sojae]MCT1903604.1 TRAP transporter small permease [Oceanobacillus sojae]
MERIESIFKYIAVFLMGVIIITVTLQIIAREIVYFPVSWTQEVAKYSFIWMSLIGAALGIRNLSHVSIDVAVSKLPASLQKIVQYFIEASIILFMIILLVQSIRFSLSATGQTSPIMGLPMGTVYVALIVFSVLSIVFAFEKIVKVKKGIIHFEEHDK